MENLFNMFKKSLLTLILFTTLLQAEFDYTIQNTNFTLSQKDIYNYDRLRLDLGYSNENYFYKLIADGVNYIGKNYINSNEFSLKKLLKSDTPFKTQTSFYTYNDGSIYAKIYRLYGGYEDEKNHIILGLQNITMGVGRLWTPTNLFNPKNIYAIEADEVFGVMALSYTRYLNDTSKITITSSIKEDKTLKYAARYKAFLDYLDLGLDFIYSDNTKMIGYELEGNLADTGIEVRSEGAYITSKLDSNNEDIDFFQGIIGADYGFVNGINIVIEGLYSTKKFKYQEIYANINSDILGNLTYSNFYAGATLSYAFNIFLDASLLYIESFNDKNTRFVSPTLTYTLNDYNTFMLGALIQSAKDESEFALFKNNRYYFNYKFSF